MPGQSLWKTEQRFANERLVRASIADARSLLADPQQWVRLQPLIIGLEQERKRPDFFRVTERLRLGGITLRHAYRARITPGADGVDSEAWSVPFIHVTNHLRCTEEGGLTRIRESVLVEAPRPLIAFVVRTAHRAHATMLDRIRDALERTARGASAGDRAAGDRAAGEGVP